MSQSLKHARDRLAAPENRASLLITLASAAFAALASLLLAGMVILGPGLKERGAAEAPTVRSGSR